MTVAYLGLGSNLGNRAEHLAHARRLLVERGAQIVRASSVIETEPWGVREQPTFLNQVLEVEWCTDARSLLLLAQAVEAQVGRSRTHPWGPREIDVDILLFGSERIAEPGLQIPHPRLREREFVLRSLRELGVPPPAG
ncbi:MAG: 2-amino-4-hydroxy-6-hydroxymethyldihydropteridine diphosphokinase [Candidatus Dormibacteraeota bacterium]|uniref:2-amino-4-hydroxy-6-hydroxymethyldihydropteridine diphosphokinase n=1 Tax=Candidatus Dormiibacter inghamiae TaxID=3127013 RepID=A0A934K6K1_9BACT|nr:2-amino-4-hydroxy-6-hydroxymethyldihydropteridine diphosphokinase [Candidatus Dormibacteraeota bacterium]MBJ7605694.1 2-amino-4-hydroxy-6-hydroxymethyldihydropteridine diphosphokinase [Candidatus Dormibacteraeota bacterium]